MTSAREMRNNQALDCHVDVNRSLQMEIYSLFHRTGATNKDVLLHLPIENACIKASCDKNVVI